MIDRLEVLHSIGYMHRDIKPENFLMGLKSDNSTLYMIDFGLAKSYMNRKTGKHIAFIEGKSLIGTARYASVGAHSGHEQGRRDDMESVCYVLLYFYRRVLPW